MKLSHPKQFACRACRPLALDDACPRKGDPCHACPVCIRLRRPCFVHFYDEPRDTRKDLEGRKEIPTRAFWCYRCKWLAPNEPCPVRCDACTGCTGTGIERGFCKAHCPLCEMPGGFCPVHYVVDVYEADRQYINEIRLGDPSATAMLKSDRQLILVNGWWDAGPECVSCKDQIVRLLLERKRPRPVVTFTDTQLLELKYARSSNGDSFTDAVTKPDTLIVRVGIWGGRTHEALPGVIVEVVRLRAAKLTVLLNEPLTPWGKRHAAWSEALEQLLDQRGARFTLVTEKENNENSHK